MRKKLTKKGNVMGTFRVSEKTWKELVDFAETHETTVSEVIRSCVEEKLDEIRELDRYLPEG